MKSSPKHLHSRVQACCMYEVVASSASKPPCCRVINKSMTSLASVRNRSLPTAMPTSEMHSTAFARNIRCSLPSALIRICFRKGNTTL